MRVLRLNMPHLATATECVCRRYTSGMIAGRHARQKAASWYSRFLRAAGAASANRKHLHSGGLPRMHAAFQQLLLVIRCPNQQLHPQRCPPFQLTYLAACRRLPTASVRFCNTRRTQTSFMRCVLTLTSCNTRAVLMVHRHSSVL